ncbi:hypothetical protein L3Q82_000265 [Scortum barcoo]|uniref:Uncharacterized protein n=1 Tax=Scortum barcoo TaxID=214431 RepID=A0ACB8XAK1_9TELE|nr:hypothetical protein L3Q82_000265 [Scortum barcoo]
MSFLRRVAGRSLRDRGGVPGVSHREEALGEDPGHAERDYVSRLAWERISGIPPEELEEVSGTRLRDRCESPQLLMDTKMIYPVTFPFSPSSLALETIQIPSSLNLGFLTRV